MVATFKHLFGKHRHIDLLLVDPLSRFLSWKFAIQTNSNFFFYIDICLKSLNTLEKAGLIKMDDGFDLKPTGKGKYHNDAVAYEYC